jgi:GDP/UDP-N,N'-diacetylbacillosamine 2-epimerase (hydrolysing)
MGRFRLRHVTYVSGTRADFGLMQRTLIAIAAHPELTLDVTVTGMHLSPRFGMTRDAIAASRLTMGEPIVVEVDSDAPGTMAIAAGSFAAQFAQRMAARAPDVLLLLGDRWEMLAAAMAATLLNIPIAHVCGGERSGTVDDAMRHAISRLAHLHLVATPDAAQRLIRSGEEASRVHVVGSPGLVGIVDDATASRADLAARFAVDPARPLAVVLFHPVVQDAAFAAHQAFEILTGVRAAAPDLQALCLLPNADMGNSAIRETMIAFCADQPGFAVATHVPREDYLSLLAQADILVGNSSSGIIEAASFGLPVVNVGDRQDGRERNGNVTDVPPDRMAVTTAVAAALGQRDAAIDNIYGDGHTDTRVAALLADVALDRALLKKVMTF